MIGKNRAGAGSDGRCGRKGVRTVEPRRRIRLRIYGRVQGVGYRYAAAETAARLGLGGWIANAPTRDDLVEGEVEGPAGAVEAFVAWARQGPLLARVQRVETEDTPPLGTREFVVRR